MTKKRIIIIICIGLAFLLILLGTLLLAMSENERKSQERKVDNYKEERTITCTKKRDSNGVIEEESVYIQKEVLITRTNTSRWENADEQTCKYYTHKSEGLNAIAGISSTTNCGGGYSVTTYQIAEMDKETTKLKQFEYINEENTFNYQLWEIYMKSNHYTCTEE